MRSFRALILGSLLIATGGMAAQAISSDGRLDLSSESPQARQIGGRGDQSLTDERQKVRLFVDSLKLDEDRKPPQSEDKIATPLRDSEAK